MEQKKESPAQQCAGLSFLSGAEAYRTSIGGISVRTPPWLSRAIFAIC